MKTAHALKSIVTIIVSSIMVAFYKHGDLIMVTFGGLLILANVFNNLKAFLIIIAIAIIGIIVAAGASYRIAMKSPVGKSNIDASVEKVFKSMSDLIESLH
jgi:hypothetical protein